MFIRVAEKADIAATLEIYNRVVERSPAVLDIHPKSMVDWEVWFSRHNVDNHPLLVAEIEGKVAGYVSLSKYREKEGYDSTVELSIYVGEAYRRRGVASALMEEIISRAHADERIHSIISVVTEVNDASRGLHKKFGFEHCGRVREAGEKFGRYLDIDYYQLFV